MKQILNISKRTLYISNIDLKPLDSHIYNEDYLTTADIKKIKSYKNLGFIQIFDVPTPIVTNKPETISNEEDKKEKKTKKKKKK